MLLNAIKLETVLVIAIKHFFVKACSCFFCLVTWGVAAASTNPLLTTSRSSPCFTMNLMDLFYSPKVCFFPETRSKSRTSLVFLLQKTLLYWLPGCCEKSCTREIWLFSLVIYFIQIISTICDCLNYCTIFSFKWKNFR